MSEQPASRYANLRDSFAAMREFIIVGAMLSLLFVPGRVRNILEDAGIRSLAGVEFDATSLHESKAEVEQARLRVDELEQKLALAQEQMTKLARTSGNLADPAFGTVSRLLASAQRSAIEAETNLNRSDEMNREFLRRHGARRQESDISSPPEQQTSQMQPMPQVQQAQQPLPSPEQLLQR